SGKTGQNVLTTAKQLLYSEGGSDGAEGSLHRLMSLTPEEMMACPGIGPVKARQIMATLELGKRLGSESVRQNPDVGTPEAVVAYIGSELRYQSVEEVHLLMTDCRSHLIRNVLVSRGGVMSTSLHPREVFREAIRANATGIILIHNHPSGCCQPSTNDIRATIRICKIGQLVGIPLNDHIIVTADNWMSMRRETQIWDQFKV
ncbi:MAG TPA: DNA repair protein RadC, partial [Clostridiaceae bacterium]|nr:DNA repair protein RadC [Clostridiaceae bacterium]